MPTDAALEVSKWVARMMLDAEFRDFLQKKGELQLPFGVTIKHAITYCPFDTNGDGDCGQRYCPFCGELP